MQNDEKQCEKERATEKERQFPIFAVIGTHQIPYHLLIIFIYLPILYYQHYALLFLRKGFWFYQSSPVSPLKIKILDCTEIITN